MSIKHEDIVELILSLTAVEKQHFKKRNEPQSDFVLLFDYINKYKTYKKIQAVAFLKKSKKKNKNYSSGYLSVLKQYLKEKIMESLRIQYYTKRAPYELIIRSLNSDIMLEKGLYSLARKEIQLAKSKFIDRSFPIEKLLLIRKESILTFYENYKNIKLDEINTLFDQRLSFAEQMVLEVKYARILTILSYQYFKGEKNDEMLRSFMAEDYMQDESLAQDFATKYLYHWVHAQFAEYQNDNKEALFHFEKAIKTWIDHPKYIEAHPRMYLGACSTYLKYLIQNKHQYSKILNIENYEQLFLTLKSIPLAEDEMKRFSKLFSIGRLLALRKEGRFIEIINQRLSFEEVITGDKPRMVALEVMLYYIISISYFYEEKYKLADHYISRVLNSEEMHVSENPEYFSLFYMLSLACQYELKQNKFLKYQHKLFKKQLLNFDQLEEFEKLFFQMVGQLNSNRFKDKAELVFNRFDKRLQEAVIGKKRGNQIEYQFLQNWVGNKIIEKS